jgi:arabinogalactan oligomer / maltooligosaccharide transport system permease protein
VRRLALALIGFAGLIGAIVVGRDLASRVRPGTTFGGVFIENGWAYALAGLIGIVLLLGLYSVAVVAVGNRLRNRHRQPLPLFVQGVTHLFMWIVIALVYYPILHLVSASFDPRNSLFSFRAIESDNVLVRAKVLPDLSEIAWSNYTRLFDGLEVHAYQWTLMGIAALGLAGAGVLGAMLRRRGSNHALEFRRTALTLAFLAAIAAVVVTLTPEQFTGRATEAKFVLWVRNTLIVAGLTGLLSVVLTATAGYAFARFRFLPGRFPMLMGFVFVQMFPGFLALIAIFYLMSRLGLLNTLTGLVLAYSGAVVSFGTWIYKGYLESLGTSLEEAAFVDGASRWQAFSRIVVPLSMPIFVFIFLMQFVGAYSEFILANLFLTGVDSWTVGIGLYSFTSGQFNTRWGIFAAASILGSLPILALFYGFQRAFVSGYTAGGVKG